MKRPKAYDHPDLGTASIREKVPRSWPGRDELSRMDEESFNAFLTSVGIDATVVPRENAGQIIPQSIRAESAQYRHRFGSIAVWLLARLARIVERLP